MLFKVLKSYLGMLAFHRYHPDEFPHFQMRCAVFVVLQEYACKTRNTVFKALQAFRKRSQAEIQLLLQRYWDQANTLSILPQANPDQLKS